MRVPEAPGGADPATGTVTVHEGRLDGEGVRVAIACSRFNGLVTERLLAGSLDALSRCGVSPADVEVAWAPGSFELPLVASRLARAGRFDAVICLGAVIRGETDHYQHVATQCVAGIQRVQLDSQVPVLLGVLTTDSTEQALERAGAKQGNKGAEVAFAALEMVNLLRALPSPVAAPAPGATPSGSGAGTPGESPPLNRAASLTAR
jgi:6,7-dimethyl-8-ribityllumazine synthase